MLRLYVQYRLGNSLVVQWLRIHLPVQRTRVQSLVQEDPIRLGATKPMHHNYLKPSRPRAHPLQQEKENASVSHSVESNSL